MNHRQVEKTIESITEPYFKSNGYRMNEFGSYLNQADNRLSFTFGSYKYYSEFILLYGASYRIDRVEKFIEKTIESDSSDVSKYTLSINRVYIDPSLELNPDISLAKGGGIIVKSEQEVRSTINLFIQEIRSLIMPFVDKIDDSWLDKTINPSIDATPKSVKFFNQDGGFWYRRLIIAKLAHNPNYHLWLKFSPAQLKPTNNKKL